MSTTGDSERLAERFLEAFSKIETFLRNNAPDQMGRASELIMLVADHNTDVRRYRHKLLQLARIRNPLVHERGCLQPLPHVVEEIERIQRKLTDQRRLVQDRYIREVEVLRTYDSVARTVDKMRRYNYSQFPVYDGSMHFAGLLTERAVARWLALNSPELVEDLRNVTVEAVLVVSEVKDNYRFIPRQTPVAEVPPLFSPTPGRPPVEALLITQNGKESEACIGIITPWDILEEAQ